MADGKKKSRGSAARERGGETNRKLQAEAERRNAAAKAAKEKKAKQEKQETKGGKEERKQKKAVQPEHARYPDLPLPEQHQRKPGKTDGAQHHIIPVASEKRLYPARWRDDRQSHRNANARFLQTQNILRFDDDLVLSALHIRTKIPGKCFERFRRVLVHDLTIHI